jgi:hypothetical protein
MHRSFIAHALLATAALFAASSARALSTVSGTLDFSIGLKDLDPSDGVAPSLTLDPQSRSTVFAGEVSAGASTSWTQQGDSAFGAVSTGGELDGTGGSASFAGDPFGAGARIAANAFGGPSLDIGLGRAYVSTPSDGQGSFVLGAQTGITLFASVTIAWNASNPGATTSGEADLALWQAVGASQDLQQRYVTGGYYGGGDGALSGSTQGTMWIAFDNESDTPMLMGYYLALFAHASELETVPPPVDEPTGAALLLAGAGALLWGVRRRR